MNNKQEYLSLYDKHDLPIQFSPDWMDAVCINGDWDVILAKDPDNNLEGVLVYHYRTYKGFKLILMPPLTFYNGIFFLYKKNIKLNSKISFEIKISKVLLDQLPKHDLYYQQYSPQTNNWMTQYWEGYKQSTRYSYILETKNEKEIWDNLKGNVRRNIKKAESSCRIETTDINTFWTNLADSFQGRQNPFRKDLLTRLYDKLAGKNAQLNICIHNETNKILAGNLIAYDKNVSYYVCGFFNPEGKEIGALSYLLWHNIINSKTENFDFEGSMLKEVEYFFRAFGGTLTPHHRIWKVNSPLLKFISKFKQLPFLQ